jgi:hypothetical protein
VAWSLPHNGGALIQGKWKLGYEKISKLRTLASIADEHIFHFNVFVRIKRTV